MSDVKESDEEEEVVLSPMPIIPVRTREGTVYLLTQDISVVEPHTSNPNRCWVHTAGLDGALEVYQSQEEIVCLWVLWFSEA